MSIDLKCESCRVNNLTYLEKGKIVISKTNLEIIYVFNSTLKV